MALRAKSPHRVHVLPDDAWVLSVYLDVDPSSEPWPDKTHRLRAALDACEKGVHDKAEWAPFKLARLWVEGFFSEYRSRGKGIALFYSPSTDTWRSTELQVRLPNLARFQKGAYVEPLAEAVSAHPRFAAVLVDNQNGRVIVYQMGEVLSSINVRDRVPKRHKQTEFDPRIEREHAVKVQRHLRHVVATLNEMRRAQAFDYLVIGGASEAFPKFLKELPPELARLVKARFTSPMYAPDAALLRAADTAVRVAEAPGWRASS